MRLIFLGLVFLESPGLGLGHFFYLPIAVIAIVRGARDGFAAGVAATALYTVAVVINADLPTIDLLTVSTPIRLVGYTLTGVLIGWFAQQNRELIDQLEVLATRDRLTGLAERARLRDRGRQAVRGSASRLRSCSATSTGCAS